MTISSADCTSPPAGTGSSRPGRASTITPTGQVEIALYADRVVIDYGPGQRAATSRAAFREWFCFGTDTLRLSGGLALDFERSTFTLTVHERTTWAASAAETGGPAWSLTDEPRTR